MDKNLCEIVRTFAEGKVVCQDKEACCSGLDWCPHPKFEGVSMKHLVKGAETGGRFSVHLVRITDGHEISEHVHPTQYEFIQCLSGKGTCMLDGKEMACEPGLNLVVPDNVIHRTTAQGEDIYLFAKFIPALI